MKSEAREFRNAGILWLSYGCLRVTETAFIVAFSGTLSLMWGALLARVPDPQPWMTVFNVGLFFATAWCVVSALFSFFTGISLLQKKTPSRADTMVPSLLALPDFPFGIILGVYTLIALMPRPAVVAERSRSRHIVIPLVPQGSR